ncbi:MAG: peroxiredoxin family protein, partial [Planctomycetota bacterium]
TAACLPQAVPQALPPALSGDGVDPIDAHSMHGSAFDVGPRQGAVLMDNPDCIEFPVSLAPGRDDLADLFHQGIGQLHGFWYLEAERTFRQVLAEDPDCAMAYWGMAMANGERPLRAAWFARSAWLKRGLVTKRERMYIDMLARFYAVEGPEEPEGLVEVRNPAPGEEVDPTEVPPERERPKKPAAERLVRDYEDLIWEYPEDIEAKAFLVNQIWMNKYMGIQTTSRMAVEALLGEVFAVQPMHPAHHYRIHLWDSKETAAHVVDSAVKAGYAWPNIAHHWHMGGHIFARLGRHYDAAWQQEASARVDHAHMARAWILPDEIHNFAHNNEWLTRSLRHQGRIDESVELAKNMIELPRHPSYNVLETPRTSSVYGRTRLIEALALFEQWEELVALGGTMYLEPHKKDPEAALRAYAMGQAAFVRGDLDAIEACIVDLGEMFDALRARRAEAVDEAEDVAIAREKEPDEVRKAMDGALRSFERDVRTMRDRMGSLEALADLVAGGDPDEGLAALKEHRFEPSFLARMMVERGVEQDDEDLVKNAIEVARKAAKGRDGQLLELASLAHVLWVAGEKEDALETFDELREGAALAQIDLPPFARLAPLAAERGLPADWRPSLVVADDVDHTVDVDALGPRHWAPPTAPDWTLSDAWGREVSLADYRGRPVLVVYFLGFGCVHCVEQLQAIAPEVARFREAGIDIVTIGLQTPEEMRKSMGDDPADSGFPFPVLADPGLEHFKEWRAYDDFEDIALHGTYLVDGAGRVRWIDISHLPFMDVEFLLDELPRLLALPVRGDGVEQAPAPEPIVDATAADPRALAVGVVTPPCAALPAPDDAVQVAVVLDTAPHCANCVADLERICSSLTGFVALRAVPNEARIEVTVDGARVEADDVLRALVDGGRPGQLD